MRTPSETTEPDYRSRLKRRRLTKAEHQRNAERLREENERVRREMTARALYGADYVRLVRKSKEA